MNLDNLDEIDMLAFMDVGKEMLNPIQWFLWRKNTQNSVRHWFFGKHDQSFDNANLTERYKQEKDLEK